MKDTEEKKGGRKTFNPDDIPPEFINIRAYLRNENNERKGKPYDMHKPKRDYLTGYMGTDKGIRLNKNGEIKLWNLEKKENWYKEKLKTIQELLSKPEFKVHREEIECGPNPPPNIDRWAFYIPLENNQAATPENIFNILEAVRELMDFEDMQVP